MSTARALVVDDAAAMRQLVRVALSGLHELEVEEADDGAAAIRLLASGHYDVLLLDLNMPVMDGWKVLSWLEGRAAPGPRIFVISTESDGDTVQRAIALGAAGVLAKPLDLQQVRHEVRTALGLESGEPA